MLCKLLSSGIRRAGSAQVLPEISFFVAVVFGAFLWTESIKDAVKFDEKFLLEMVFIFTVRYLKPHRFLLETALTKNSARWRKS